jgi:hypothetical protein
MLQVLLGCDGLACHTSHTKHTPHKGQKCQKLSQVNGLGDLLRNGPKQSQRCLLHMASEVRFAYGVSMAS